MTAPDLDEFGRRVRGLDPAALTRFAAVLYAARGFETTVTGEDRFVATAPGDEPDRTRTVRVATATPTRSAGADVVVLARESDRTTVDGAEVVDVNDLHRMALYGVERDRFRALAGAHLDGPGDSEGTDSHWRGWVAPVRRAFNALGDPQYALVTTLLAVSVLALAAMAVGPADRPTTGPATERTVTAVPVSTQGGGTVTTVAPGGDGGACRAPPPDLHPASFRPVPAQAAVSTGLESWEHRLSVNTSVFYGPSPVEIRWQPELRHESTYRTPEGGDIVLTIDRWNGSAAAARSGRSLALEYGLSVVWGQYTFTVTYYSAFANATVEPTTEQATSRLLLSQVTGPDGKLGRECLDTLLIERTA
jgi:hypothetical protein